MAVAIEPISKHFTWFEALYCPSWGREANTEDGLTDPIRANLEILFSKMDMVREHFNLPIRVHCAYRPVAYNRQVNGVINSPHIEGKACDFDLVGLNCDYARAHIMEYDLLDIWDMRMERVRYGSNWIHLDFREEGPSGRYFNP